MKKKKKWIVITIIAAAVIIVLGGIATHSKKNKGKDEVVRIEEVKRGDLTERVSATGEVEPKEFVQISTRVSARIIEIPYDEGNYITCGDANANPPIPPSILVKLDSKDLESQLKLAVASKNAQEAQIDVEKSKLESSKQNLISLAATLEQAQKDLERKKGLFDSRDISKADFDLVKYKADELAAQYESAKYSLESSEKNMSVLKYNLEGAEARIQEVREMIGYTTITSPINGVITRMNSKVGEVVTGATNYPGTVIMEVSDLSKMLVVAQVDEADVGSLQLGQTATVQVQAFPNIKYTGKVSEIALKYRLSTNGQRYFRTEILLDNDPNVAKLYTGLTADVDIETQKHNNIIKIPSQAVLAREVDGLPLEIRDKSDVLDKNKKFTTVVYRFIDGKAVATPVKAGQSDLTHTIILAGLNEGDKVVVGPYKSLDTLKHDQKLKDEREAEKEKSKSASAKSPDKKKETVAKASEKESKEEVKEVNAATGK